MGLTKYINQLLSENALHANELAIIEVNGIAKLPVKLH